ncbi:complement C1r subcomponent-like isoform X2 [Poecilia reticulata]|uniref:complement C1r subcomponent-like isoform X2 n=1 Tax=Poecilia reticulata TaxID=8081 RepID=UPI0007E942AA|nr:PREDICTED: complement C1r subcomponent-like isoform X2 [Poecilia reticulata]
MDTFNARIGWTSFITWFLHVLVCECVPLPDSGQIHSPQCPQLYPVNLQKQWEISVPDGFQISLTFTHVDIKSSITVLYDEKPILSPGNRLKLIFQSHDYNPDRNQNVGFSARYQAIDIDECSAPEPEDGSGPLCSQKCLNTLGSYRCACHHGYKLHSDQRACMLIDCGEPEPLLNGGVTLLSGFQNQYLSVVQYHCNEPFYSPYGGINVSLTCEADGQWRSNHDVILRPACLPVCGRPTKQNEYHQRIIGGNDAAEHTIPWQAFINVGYSRGGGMIIADRWILTAAHMVVINGQVQTPEALSIYLGLADVPQILETPSLNATAVHVHRQYNNPNGLNYDHDIALIKLKDPVTFKAAIMPLCLPSKNDTYDTGMMGLVSGFGITDKGNYLRFLTNKLKYVHIPVVEQQRCSNSLRGTPRTKKPILTDNMFCAGTPEGGKDSCIGDDGSGFTLQSENGRFWAAGIVSWGFRCGQKGTYGFYTKVANYVDWINKIMQEN